MLRTARGTTPLAAIGLVTIMAGAVAVTVQGGTIAPAAMPLLIGALAALVAPGRREWPRLLAATTA